MEKDKEFNMDEYEVRVEKCFELANKLTLKQYCDALYACLDSIGENECSEDCPFINCCIMPESPDTMLYDVLSGYRRFPDFAGMDEIIKKSQKYDKIKELLKGELDE